MRSDNDRPDVDPAGDDIQALRELLADRGLLPPIPAQYATTSDDDVRVLARVLTSVQVVDTPSVPSQRRRLRTLSLVAATAVVAVAVGSQLGGGTTATATAPVLHLAFSGVPARDTLLELAETAAGVEPVGEGDVQYVAQYGWLPEMTDEGTTAYPTFTQSWLGADGALTISQTRGGPLTADGLLDLEGRASSGVGESSDALPPGSLDPQLVAGAFENSQDGLDALDTTDVCETPITASCLLGAAWWLASTYATPGNFYAAFWTELSNRADIVTFGTTDDRTGRQVVTLAVNPTAPSDSGVTTVYFADAKTGALVGWEDVRLDVRSAQEQTAPVVAFTAIVDSRFVRTVGDTQ